MDQFIALVVVANANKDEALIEFITKAETVQKEEDVEFITIYDIKQIAQTAEARGATKVTKINDISAKRIVNKKKAKIIEVKMLNQIY